MEQTTTTVTEGRYERNGNYAYDICKRCKGKHCCAHFGCMFSPQDFIVLKDPKYTHEQQLLILTELLKQGKISIDMCWLKDTIFGPLNVMTKRPDIDKISDGDGMLYLRARNKDRPIVDLQYFLKEGGHYPCASWDPEKGCMLSEDERPYGGRMLKPVAIKDEHGESYICEDVSQGEILNLWHNSQLQLLLYDLYLNVRDLDNN